MTGHVIGRRPGHCRGHTALASVHRLGIAGVLGEHVGVGRGGAVAVVILGSWPCPLLPPGHSVLGGGVSLATGRVLGAVSLTLRAGSHRQRVGLGRVRLAWPPGTMMDQSVDLASSRGLHRGVVMVLRDHHRVHAGPVHGSAVLE